MKAEFDRARLAVDFLEAHRIAPSPIHYEFALHYVTHTGSDLARAVNDQVDGGLRLTAEIAATLIARHLAPERDAATGRREQVIARQAEELGTLTTDAYQLTRSLEGEVGAAVREVDALPPGIGGLATRLGDAERELAELRGEFAKLRSEIGGTDRPAPDQDRDELTKALNQSAGREMLAQFAALHRNYAMVMFSVDNLVAINRGFGTSVGDNVLNAFAATLRQVFTGSELIRWTGNEFIVLVKDKVLTAVRLLVEEALLGLAARRLKLRGTGEWIGVVTASAGIVAHQADPQSPSPMDELIERARGNLLVAIAAGGDRSQG